MGKTKKLSLALLLAVSAMLSACGSETANNENGNTQAAKEETISLRLGHHIAEDHSVNKEYIEKFASLVKEKSQGKIVVETYPNGQLGGQRELTESLEMGSLDMSYSDTGILANYDAGLGLLDLPFLFDDIEHAKSAMEKGMSDKIKQRIESSSGIKLMSFVPVAFRGSILVDKPVTNINDFQGMKIRTPEIPVIVETFKALGASPTVIPSGEAYTAIQTHVVDGMEGHKEFLNSIKIQEVTKYYSETKHNLTFSGINMSKKVYDKLSPDQQKIVVDAAAEAEKHFNEINKEIDNSFKKTLEEQGLVFNELDLTELRKATEPMVQSFIEQNKVQDIIEIINQTR